MKSFARVRAPIDYRAGGAASDPECGCTAMIGEASLGRHMVSLSARRGVKHDVPESVGHTRFAFPALAGTICAALLFASLVPATGPAEAVARDSYTAADRPRGDHSLTRVARRERDLTRKYQWLFKDAPKQSGQGDPDTGILNGFDREVKEARKLYLSGRPEQALAQYRKAIDLFETIMDEIPPGDPVITEMDRRTRVFEELASKILGQVQVEPQQDLAARLFHLMEERRACVLALALKKVGPITFFDVPEKLVRSEARLLAQLHEMSGQPVDSRTRKAEQTLRSHLSRVRTSLRRSSARFAFLQRGIPPQLADVQRDLLAEHEVILDFNLFRDRLVIGVITTENAIYHQFSADPSQIEEGVFLLQDKLREFTTGERSTFMGHAWKETSRRLYRSLLGRLPPLPAGKKTVFVIPDKALWYLPFSVLLDPEDRPFGQGRLVSIIPSVDLLAFRRTPVQGETRSHSPHNFLVFECLPWISERDVRQIAGRDLRAGTSRAKSPQSEKIERLILSNPVYPKPSKVVATIMGSFKGSAGWTGPRATARRWLERKEGGRKATLLAVPLAVTDRLSGDRGPSFFFSPDKRGERRFPAQKLFSKRLGSDLLIMPTAWYDVPVKGTSRGEGPLLLSTAVIYSGVRMALINYSAPNWGDGAPLLMTVLGKMAQGSSPGQAIAQYPRDLPAGVDSSFSGRPPAWAGWILMGDPGQ